MWSPLLVTAALLVSGCTAPVGVRRISVHDEHRQLTRTALTDADASDVAQIVLRRHNLVELYAEYPETALMRLRAIVISGDGRDDDLFALAELSYLYAQQAGSRPHALASALYAYAYLFPDDPAERPDGIDPRFRWACDIYAEGLMQALREPGARALGLEGGTYPLPFGSLAVTFDRSELMWGSRMLTDPVPVSEYEIYGMRNRYRQPGIGVALAAQTVPMAEGTRADKLIEEKVRVPGAIVLRLDHPRQQIAGTALNGQLDLLLQAAEHPCAAAPPRNKSEKQPARHAFSGFGVAWYRR
jgi:hypothetical protein